MPSYIKSYENGSLKTKICEFRQKLEKCDICPRKCGVNRLKGEKGFCSTGKQAIVSSTDAHFGEETVLVGRGGSGTIFFNYCNLKCDFCQNYEISCMGYGREVNDEELAQKMLHLQNIGCENINFVTPSHVVPQILSALQIAIDNGLELPLVYNTGGYDSVDTIKMLDGIIDIYMPDFKFWDDEFAELVCRAGDYKKVACDALKEMQRQVGELIVDDRGVAEQGILLRHLVLPENLAGTREIMKFIASEISPNTYVNIMAQYRPCGKAGDIDRLSRAITGEEFAAAVKMAEQEGITRLDNRNKLFWA